MRRTYSRRIAILTTFLGLGVVAASIAVSRGVFLEYWCVFRLRSNDAGVRNRAIEILEAHKSLFAVPGLLDVACKEESSRTQALRALEQLLPQAKEEIQRHAAEALLWWLAGVERQGGFWIARGGIGQELAEGSRDPAAILHRVGPKMPGALEVFAKELGNPESSTFGISARILLAAWPTDSRHGGQSRLEHYLLEADSQAIIAFFRAAAASTSFWDAYPSWTMPLPNPGRALATWLARTHRDPAARAAALGFALYQDQEQSDMALVSEFTAEGFPQPLRRAAIRLTGYLGNRAGAVDLGALLMGKTEPELLVDFIQARELWTSSWREAHGIDLGCGVACDWIAHPLNSSPAAVPWREQELERLSEILQKERNDDLRDAASMGMTGRFRLRGNSVDKPPVESPFLEVHEWGVWRDGGEFLTVSQQILDELPPFVHRTSVSAEVIAKERSYMPTAATKPVIFFYVHQPLSLLVQVRFFEGRPWTYYPRVTDYLETTRGARHGSRSPTVFSAAGGFRDRPGISPPWKLSGISQGLYPEVPWLIRAHPPFARMTGQGDVELAGLGIEWCGLRVGYPDEVEPDLKPASQDSWWRLLRDVAATPVAVRGERERFLFYDGSANVPAPIIPAWEDEKRGVVLLRERSPGEYPTRDWLPWPECDEPVGSQGGTAFRQSSSSARLRARPPAGP